MRVLCPLVAISVLLFIAVSLHHAIAEVFTSTAQLVEHFQVEHSLDQALQTYIKKEKLRLKKLRNFLRLKKQDLQRRLSDVKDLNGLIISPVNTFATLNQFKDDWEEVVNHLIEQPHREDFLNVLSQQNDSLQLFSRKDFDGALNALVRLSKVYDINPWTLLQGKIDNHSVKPVYTQESINNQSKQLNQSMVMSLSGGKIDTRSITNQLTAMDTFRLGRQAYINGYRKLALIWMESTISIMGTQYTLRDMAEDTNRSEVLNHLAFLEYQFENYNKSLGYYQEMARYNPSDEILLDNLDIMKSLVAKNVRGNRLTDDDEDDNEFMNDYICKCRKAEQDGLFPSNDPTLTCYYDNSHPRSYLKPFRVETLSINPRIQIFRGVLSDKEVDGLISLARPKLLRAGVNNLETGISEIVDYRISKNAWLKDDDSDLVRKINERIGALTGLNMDTAEELQVNNYGLGGQYEPHVDHAVDMSISSIAKMGRGNRIATLMFYLSDVEAGGATVFVKLNISSKAIKGDALFWYNLKKSGEGDFDTLHAGCPVLLGDKWVANKWIHEYGNEFLRPCGLTENE